VSNSPRLTLAVDTGRSKKDRITSDGTIAVSNVSAGATWQYSLNSGRSWKTGSGSKFRVKPGVYEAGKVQVRQRFSSGQFSPANTSFAAFTVDTKVKVPRLNLVKDTGSSSKDRITADGRLRLKGLEQGASWDYSLDAGKSWVKGSGTTFLVPQGDYASGQVQVRQLDLAGNLSAAQTSFPAFSVDTEAVVPGLGLVHDGGVRGDRVTNVADLRLSDLEPGATWEYSIDGGNKWSTGSGQTFSVPDGRYSNGQVQVRQTDLAGNTSQPFTKFASFTIDTESPTTPTLELLADTGSSDTDRITSEAGIVVLGRIEANAVWQYTINGGATWTTDGGKGFLVPEGRYADGQVQVRQLDLAGNRSRPFRAFKAFTVDFTPPEAPGMALAEDTDVAGDRITSNGTINVTALERGATWQYSLDAGTTWTDGSNSSFEAPAGSYTLGQVQVRQSDLAGNEGLANTSFLGFTVTPPALQSFSSAAAIDPVTGKTYSWTSLADTTLANPDAIVGYSSVDQIAIDGLSYATTLNRSAGEIASLTNDNLVAFFDASRLPASVAAAFTVDGVGGTYVALNDQRPGFQSDTDGLLLLKDYSVGSTNTITIV
jgi:hypothetical protein